MPAAELRFTVLLPSAPRVAHAVGRRALHVVADNAPESEHLSGGAYGHRPQRGFSHPLCEAPTTSYRPASGYCQPET